MSVGAASLLPELARHDGVLAWTVPKGWCAISSAAVGGGISRPRWVLNATVDGRFARTDLAVWAGEVAARVGLDGPGGSGCALLTAADVNQVEHAGRGGVDVWATVGVTKPTWPHDPRAVLSCHTGRQDDHRDTTERHDDRSVASPGTVNIVVRVPVALTPSALVQAVGTVTEAKAQVLVRSGVPGTGTASDAVVVLCPDADAPEESHRESLSAGRAVPFAGVRSAWGRRIAHAVHDAVLAGLTAHPWGEGPAATGQDGARVW